MEEIDFLISILNKKTEHIKKEEEEKFPTINKTIIVPQLNNIKKNNKIGEIKIIREKNINNVELPSLFKNKIQTQDEFSNKINSNTNLFIGPLLRYLDFRPFIDKLENKPKTPPDLGYYYVMLGTECPLVRNLLEDNGFVERSGSKEMTILWSSGSIKASTYTNLKKYQKVNHFPRSVELTRKDLLYKNLTKLQSMLPNLSKSLSFIPESFILPNEYKFLQEAMEKDQNAIWIVKPVSSSQGRGIYITNSILEIPSGVQLIVSKYIHNPFLIDGYKFDMRIYVCMTSINPLRLYIYEEGFVRFATEKYYAGQPFNSNNKFIHLTNYAVNKLSKNFVPNTDPFVDDIGSKWSLSALKKYFSTININFDEIFKRIEDVVVKTIISAENNMMNAFNNTILIKNPCFELFGFDILLDSSLNPWLMEVNLSPSLHCDSPLDVKIKGELIAEIFDLSRIIPLNLREKESEFIKYNLNSSLDNKILKDIAHIDFMKDFKFTKEVKEILWDTDEELKRLKSFKRIFPNELSLNYRKFFIEENPINLILSLKALYETSNPDKENIRKIKKINLINLKKNK